MSKLIKLPNGPYIEASKITKIGEPWEVNRHIYQWAYSVAYLEENEIRHHTVLCNGTFVKCEESAKNSIDRFVSYVNENR